VVEDKSPCLCGRDTKGDVMVGNRNDKSFIKDNTL
jgi:hypothetical protein